MSRFPGASGARVMAMCRTAARFQAGRTPAGGVAARRTWPRSVRLRLGACHALIGGKKVPDYLLRMIDDYLSGRWATYEGDKWSLKEEMTCGAP